MNNILDMNILTETKRIEIWGKIMLDAWKKHNIKDIKRDPINGYVNGIVFDTKEDLITFKLKYF